MPRLKMPKQIKVTLAQAMINHTWITYWHAGLDRRVERATVLEINGEVITLDDSVVGGLVRFVNVSDIVYVDNPGLMI